MIAKKSISGIKEVNQELPQKLAEKEQERQHIAAINRRQASIPVLEDLAQAGFSLERISDLYNKRMNYKMVIPILLKWLPLVENVDIKETITRALAVPWAKPVAAPLFIAEFHKMQNESNTGIKWAIANSLAVVADDSVFMDIVNLIQDPQNGNSRKMLALALGNMKDGRAEDILIALLDDEEVAGHAIMSLGKLKSKKAYPAIERFLTHPKTWVRNAAKKALAKIEKAGR